MKAKEFEIKKRDPNWRAMQDIRRSGAGGQHKDKKKAVKQGEVKHKGKIMAEGADELYGLRIGDTVTAKVDGQRVQGDIIDIFPDDMEVELLLRGPETGRTVVVDVRDTEIVEVMAYGTGFGSSSQGASPRRKKSSMLSIMQRMKDKEKKKTPGVGDRIEFGQFNKPESMKKATVVKVSDGGLILTIKTDDGKQGNISLGNKSLALKILEDDGTITQNLPFGSVRLPKPDPVSSRPGLQQRPGGEKEKESMPPKIKRLWDRIKQEPKIWAEVMNIIEEFDTLRDDEIEDEINSFLSSDTLIMRAVGIVLQYEHEKMKNESVREGSEPDEQYLDKVISDLHKDAFGARPDHEFGREWMSSSYEGKLRIFKNMLKSLHSDIDEATGDEKFDTMMRTIKKGTKKQATADRREREAESRKRARDAFGPSPADRLSIRSDKGMEEGYTTEKQILTRIRQIMHDRKLSGTESNAGELHRLKQQLKDMRSQQGVAEDSDWGEPREILEDVLRTLEREVEWPLTEVMDPREVRQLLAPIIKAVNDKMMSMEEGWNDQDECREPIFHESMINEKHDACYHKVKSRYKVWPSAYASGALVQCRKKGAKNWGKKSN